MTISTTFTATGKSSGTSPLQLTGSAGSPVSDLDTLNLRKKSPIGGTIPDGNEVGALNVPDPLFTTLVGQAVPFNLTLIGTNTSGVFTVTDIQLAPGARRMASDVQGISGSAAAAEPLGQDAYLQIISELRSLNQRMGSIERLLATQGIHEAPTGT
ncbi:MAG TPA: hypothetical protein VMI54_30855 [Polyangiaceae bacterium]|nr:hypothetical protein [Polyangiaceae bacterium]